MRNSYKLTSANSVLQFVTINVDSLLEQLLPGLISSARIILRLETFWSLLPLAKNSRKLAINVVDLSLSYLYELLLNANQKDL